MEADEEGGVCGNVTKGVVREEAGMPCKRRSAEKKVEEGGIGGGGMHGQATKSVARMKEKLGGRIEKEDGGAL